MKKLFQVLLNLLIAFLVLRAWGQMFRGVEGGVLSSAGLRSLRYFTVLSNLLEAAASLLFLIPLLTGREHPFFPWLKFTAAVSVGLTFFTVILFLGPLFGYASMFKGANLWLHLIVPLLAMAEQIILNDAAPGRTENLLALVPMLLYAVYYIGNVLMNGRGEAPVLNDFYGFFLWGLPMAMVIFGIIILADYGIGAGMRFLNSRLHL